MNLQLALHNAKLILRKHAQDEIENFVIMGELPDGRRLHLFYDEDADMFNLSLSTETVHDAVKDIVVAKGDA